MTQTGDSGRSWVTAGLGDAAWAALAGGLPASEVWSLLLDVMASRAARRTPADLMRQWREDGIVRPAAIDQRTLVELDGHLLAAARAFEAVEFSPVGPLGACSVVGLAGQNRILSALRGTELVGDPTNVMALECASRLRARPHDTVRLATCHRCIRTQPVPKRPGFTPHFRIFCLATAGLERRGHALLIEALVEQIATHLAALDRLEQHGYAFPNRRVTVLATPEMAPRGDSVAQAIQSVPVSRAPLEHPYYDGLRFMINAGDSADGGIPLIDGGVFDWVGTLASNRRLVFVASGMGSQLVASVFRGRK